MRPASSRVKLKLVNNSVISLPVNRFLFQDRILVFWGQILRELVVWSASVMNTKPRPFHSPKGSATRKCQTRPTKLRS